MDMSLTLEAMTPPSLKPSSPIEVSSSSSPRQPRSSSPSRPSPQSPSKDTKDAAAQPGPAAAATGTGTGTGTGPDAAPAAPKFIKRSSVRKSNLRKPSSSSSSSSSAAFLPNDAPLSPESPDAAGTAIGLMADFKYARKLRARGGGRGVDTGTLVAALAGGADDEAADKEAADKGLPDISKLESVAVGGLSKVGAARDKEGYLSSFTGTNKTLDATKHMERYIEDQLAKRRQSSSTSTSSSDAPAAAAPISYDDELYTLPEHLRISKPDVIEGSVTASAAMLTAIPEIDLGPESKSKAIVQTERMLARTGAASPGADLEHDLAFHNNPFPAMRWRISRKTRESLYDMTHGAGAPDADAAAVEQAVAEELTRDRRGQRTVGAQGIVTNDDELRRKFELERRLGEVSSGREVRSVKVDHKEREGRLRGRERDEAERGEEAAAAGDGPVGKKRRVGEAE